MLRLNKKITQKNLSQKLSQIGVRLAKSSTRKMYVNREHPHFSVPMEILCLLPIEPRPAYIDFIMHDLKITEGELDAHINWLDQRGYHVEMVTPSITALKKVPYIFIRKRHWDNCRGAAKTYYERIYGE